MDFYANYFNKAILSEKINTFKQRRIAVRVTLPCIKIFWVQSRASQLIDPIP